MRGSIKVIFASFILLLSGSDVFSASRIGSLRLIHNADRSGNLLQQLPGGSRALLDFAFVGKIGGVAFEAIASLPPALSDGRFEIKYDPSAPNGQRARVIANGSSYGIRLPDWQLRPIAEFANSKFTGVVSLFGEGPNRTENFYVDYHPAFLNRLLGLRLLQADIVLIDPEELSRMPVEENGTITFGAGEVASDDAKRKEAAGRLSRTIATSAIQSWVLTDVDRPMVVTLADNQLTISGRPYYYFWRTKLSTDGEDVIKRFEIAMQIETRKRRGLATADLEAELERLKNRLQRSSRTVTPLSEVSTAIESQWNDLLLVNGPVYNAVLNVSRHAALFRALQRANPGQWSKFMDTITTIDVERIETPNQIPRQ